MNVFKTSFLFASMFWSSVGVGYFIYGKRQQALSAMIGGICMVADSVLVGSALVMSLSCLGVAVAVYLLVKRGY
jgi:hypothetical protein